VQGRFPVWVWQNGLIVEQDGTLRAVGPSPTHHNLYPLQPADPGRAAAVVAERVTMRGIPCAGWSAGSTRAARTTCWARWEMPDGRGPALTGRLDSVDTYNPASYRGGILRLHYARAAELGPCWISWPSGAR